MMVVRVGKKSQIVIPVDIRKQLGIKEGDELLVSTEGRRIVLSPKPDNYTSFGEGLGAKIWREVDTTEYLRKERDSWHRPSNGN